MCKPTNYSSDQALYSKETMLGLTNSLPSQPSFRNLCLSLQTLSPPSPLLSQPVHGEREAFLAVTEGLLAATAPPAGPLAFPGTNTSRAVWQLKATCASSQSSRKREIFSPDWSCPITIRARLSRLRSHCSNEEVPSLSVHHSTSLSQAGLFGQPYFHMSPETDCRLIQLHLLLPKGADQSAHTPSAFPQRQKSSKGTACVRATGSFLMRKKRSSLCGPYFPGSSQQLDDVRAPRPMGPGQTPSQKGHSHIFAKSLHQRCCKTIATTKIGNDTLLNLMPTLSRDSPSIQMPSPMPPSGL